MLYCATEPEGAIGEKLAPFAPNAAAAIRIEAFLQGEPDAEFSDDYLEVSLDAEDIDSFEWLLARAPAVPGSRFVDLWHPATTLALLPGAASLLLALLWEPLPLNADEAYIQTVDIDTPALRTAAELLGVVLRG